jgi:hypothetical protein
MSPTRRPRLSAEDRRASLLADIDALPTSRRGDRPGVVRQEVDFVLAAYSAVRAAAALRRLSVSAFVRRAAYALAAADLGLPVTDLTKRDPRVARENGFAVDDPDASTFGSWDVEVRNGADG